MSDSDLSWLSVEHNQARSDTVAICQKLVGKMSRSCKAQLSVIYRKSRKLDLTVAACPNEIFTDDDGTTFCYFVPFPDEVNARVKWDTADDVCACYSPDAILIEPDSAEKVNFLANQWTGLDGIRFPITQIYFSSVVIFRGTYMYVFLL